MAVAPDGDARNRPMPPDALDQAAQPSADFRARWRFARTQDHGDRASSRGVVTVDGQKAALIVMSIPFRHLLTAMRDVGRIVDVQNH